MSYGGYLTGIGMVDAGLTSVPNDDTGDAIPGFTGQAMKLVADLKTFLDERLARYKLPRSIVVMDALPLTAIGKIDKKLLEKYEVAQ